MGQSPDQEKKQDQIMMANEKLAVQNTAYHVAANNSARLDLAYCGKACTRMHDCVLLLIRSHHHIQLITSLGTGTGPKPQVCMGK